HATASGDRSAPSAVSSEADAPEQHSGAEGEHRDRGEERQWSPARVVGYEERWPERDRALGHRRVQLDVPVLDREPRSGVQPRSLLVTEHAERRRIHPCSDEALVARSLLDDPRACAVREAALLDGGLDGRVIPASESLDQQPRHEELVQLKRAEAVQPLRARAVEVGRAASGDCHVLAEAVTPAPEDEGGPAAPVDRLVPRHLEAVLAGEAGLKGRTAGSV